MHADAREAPVKNSRALRRSVRNFAYALLTVGAIGALGSLVGMGITFAISRDSVGIAVDALQWSGVTLCAAAALFFVGRLLGAEE